MNRIFIDDLRLQAIIGVYPEEREQPQMIAVDVEMAWDTRAAALSDDLHETIDYHAVVKRLTGFIDNSRFQLVETLAERCAEILLKEFDLPWVRIRITKKQAIEQASGVGVLIERGVLPV
ncbi:MAG: dihydroneopterin aldolase [Wenzhouxiangellaceae bacterium]